MRVKSSKHINTMSRVEIAAAGEYKAPSQSRNPLLSAQVQKNYSIDEPSRNMETTKSKSKQKLATVSREPT